MKFSIRAMALLLMAAVTLGSGFGLEAQKRSGKKRQLPRHGPRRAPLSAHSAPQNSTATV